MSQIHKKKYEPLVSSFGAPSPSWSCKGSWAQAGRERLRSPFKLKEHEDNPGPGDYEQTAYFDKNSNYNNDNNWGIYQFYINRSIDFSQ